jgi:hypothetical protein
MELNNVIKTLSGVAVIGLLVWLVVFLFGKKD